MIRFDVSALTQARLGTSLNLDVDTGPQRLTDGSTETLSSSVETLAKVLEVDFLRGTLQAIRVQEGLLIQGALESQLGLECVRCLEHFVLPITLEIEEIFQLPRTDPQPDVSYVVSDDGWLNLSPLLREQAWVAIPMKPLCRPDCNGLCPQCGANLNLESCACDRERIDPRMAALKDLVD